MRYTRGKMALPIAALSLPFPPVPRVNTTESLSIWCPDPLSSYFPILHTPPSLSVATWPPPPFFEKGAPLPISYTPLLQLLAPVSSRLPAPLILHQSSAL